VTLASPHWLWLLLAVPLVVWLAWRGRLARSRRRLIAACALRAAALALLAVALARPVLLERSSEVSIVYAMDVSRSISRTFLQQTLEWIRARQAAHPGVHSRYVVFARRAAILERLEDVATVGDATDVNETDLEQALRTAALGFAPGTAKRLVLVSDGNATRGDVWRALPQLQAERVRLYAMPAAVAVSNDAWVESIELPDDVRREEPVIANVAVFSRLATPARVELAAGSRMLAGRRLQLEAGQNTIALRVQLPEQGSVTLTARVTAQGDEDDRNDTLTTTVQVRGRPRVLYVESAPESAHYLAEALRAQHIDVEPVPPAALATESLDRYDVVLMSDVPASAIDAKAANALETFVRDHGGGLIFAAGDTTFGKQGYAQSAVERLLPVRMQGKRKRRELDLVLLIDRSHSMRGRKLELAKTAALSTLDLLEKQHRLAVVAFDSRPHEVVPLAEVGSKRRAEDLLSSMTASGQTNIYNALVEAQRILTDSKAGTKHIILLSDGITAPPGGVPKSDSERTQEEVMRARADTMRALGVKPAEKTADAKPLAGGMDEVVDELARAKVTLSTVAIGEKPDLELMKRLAVEGKGKSYVAASDAEIPGLFVSETRRLLGEAIVEEPFRPEIVNRAQAIAGIDFAGGPPLKGYVVSRPKRFAETLLEAPQKQPLLVQTHYGLGKTVAFMSDVKNRWAAAWIGWAGYGQLWAQVVRDAMARSAPDGVQFDVRRHGGEAVIELTALDAKHLYRDNLAPRVRMRGASGAVSLVPLRQVGPGRYRAAVAVDAGGSDPYRFEPVEGGGITRADLAQLGTRSVSYPWSDEFRGLPPDNALLRALSESTGGAFASKGEEMFAPRGDGGLITRALWPWFAAAALVLFLLDILVRRLPRF
jgi:uncharacterized membrane protein